MEIENISFLNLLSLKIKKVKSVKFTKECIRNSLVNRSRLVLVEILYFKDWCLGVDDLRTEILNFNQMKIAVDIQKIPSP